MAIFNIFQITNSVDDNQLIKLDVIYNIQLLTNCKYVRERGFYMLKLVRKNDDVFYNDTKLKINVQKSKGPGNEVVYIFGLPESNGAQWISLSKLKQGINEIYPKAKIYTKDGVSKPGKDYVLTTEEELEIATMKKRYDEIIEAAKARYVPKPDLDVNVKELSLEEKLEKLEQVKKFFGLE